MRKLKIISNTLIGVFLSIVVITDGYCYLGTGRLLFIKGWSKGYKKCTVDNTIKTETEINNYSIPYGNYSHIDTLKDDITYQFSGTNHAIYDNTIGYYYNFLNPYDNSYDANNWFLSKR